MIKPFWRWTVFLALVVTLVFISGSSAHADVSVITLENGLRIITVQSHAVPIVAVDAWVRAGTRREKPGEPGVAHFLEHLLFKGTTAHPDEESVDGTIEDLGGTLDAATSYDWAHFYTEVPSSGYSQALALIADILQHATLKSTFVDEERPIILDEVNRDTDDPLTALSNTVRSIVYTPSSAYSRSITGTADQVRAVTRDQIADFYNTYYVPNNVTLVISGDVKASEVQKIVADQFGTWRKSPNLPVDGSSQSSVYQTIPSDQNRVRKSLSQKDADESYLVFAFSAPSVSDQPDTWDMDVLLTLLGQGGNNRLTEQLKNKSHLVNTIQTDYLTQKDPGILTISASIPTANASAVEAGILDQIERLRTQPVSADELQTAKIALKANYLFDVDTDSGHADSLGFYDCIDTYEYDVDYLSRIGTVSAADVERVAQKYLDTSAYTEAIQVPTPDVSTASVSTSSYRPYLLLAQDKAPAK